VKQYGNILRVKEQISVVRVPSLEDPNNSFVEICG
jgi:hypothetical protein